MDWFRLYAEFATDPKVQMMDEAMQRRLVMLFCLQCSNGVETFHETEREAAIAFALRISDEELAETKALFIHKGFIDSDWSLRNWNKRQYVSDSSTARVRKHREAKKQAQKEDETLLKRSSNALEQNRTDTDKNIKEPPIPPSGGVAGPERPEKKKPPKRDEPSPDFLQAWDAYPRRDGPNPRKTAWDAWKARIRAGTDPSELLDGVKRYAAWIEDKGQSGTRFVMMASTFFGPGEHWRETYGGPVEPEWWRPAGFESRFDAENAGCNRFIADQFRGGKRLEVHA